MTEQERQERQKRLLGKLNRLEAYHEIQNEMGRLTAAFNFHQKEKGNASISLWEIEDVSRGICG